MYLSCLTEQVIGVCRGKNANFKVSSKKNTDLCGFRSYSHFGFHHVAFLDIQLDPPAIIPC